jgi:hypothetical protein
MNREVSGKPLKELTVKLQHIGIAADHGGYELKEYLAGKLTPSRMLVAVTQFIKAYWVKIIAS